MTTLAVLCDYVEEGWPSMDLCAGMLIRALQDAPGEGISPVRIQPRFRRRLTALAGARRVPLLWKADRLLNRLWDYPHEVPGAIRGLDLFHVADHSYAHLVHVLPAARTGVYCHDLDTFRCLLAPHLERRPAWFRAMARHILSGLRKASVVFYSTAAVRQQIERARIVPAHRLVAAPLGVAPEFAPEGGAHGATLPRAVRPPYLLHVGSCIPRKRIDVLVEAYAAARATHRQLRLIQVGGTFTDGQREHMARLGVAEGVVQLRGVETATLAELYRRAALVVQPSEAEGFGLPVAEALACGAPVLASDIPVLREVGGAAVAYAPPGDVTLWREHVTAIVGGKREPPSPERRLQQARRFTWDAHARAVAAAYRRLALERAGSGTEAA